MVEVRDRLPYSAKRASFAKAVGSFVPGLTRKSFEKYGFSTATLLTDWALIVGQDLAGFTLPERLKWPRNVEAFEETNKSDRGRPGATLVLRVDGPRAIELQYQTTQLIERINAHFGYRAIAEIRFIQAPLPDRAEPSRATEKRIAKRPKTSDRNVAESPSTTGPNSTLQASLERLHENMRRAKLRKAV